MATKAPPIEPQAARRAARCCSARETCLPRWWVPWLSTRYQWPVAVRHRNTPGASRRCRQPGAWVFTRVRREALVDGVEVEGLDRGAVAAGLRKLRAACPGRCRGGWQAALTKPGRASTARWCGSGERGGKAYARNRRLRPSKTHRLETWRIWAGCDAHPPSTICRWSAAGELSVAVRIVDREAAVKCCGMAAARSQGSSRVPPPPSHRQVNTGTVPGPP